MQILPSARDSNSPACWLGVAISVLLSGATRIPWHGFECCALGVFSMKRLLALLSILIGLGAASFLIAPSRGLAQDTGAVKSGADQAEPPTSEEPPPGGCMPIGV